MPETRSLTASVSPVVSESLSGLAIGSARLATAAVFSLAAASRLTGAGPSESAASAAAAALLVAAAILLFFYPTLARWLSTAAVASFLYAGHARLLTSPAATLAVGLCIGLFLNWLWTVDWEIRAVGKAPFHYYWQPVSRAQRQTGPAILLLAALLLIFAPQEAPLTKAAVYGAGFLAACWGMVWLGLARVHDPLRARIGAAFGVASCLAAAILSPTGQGFAGAAAAFGLGIALLARRERFGALGSLSWWELLLEHPARMLVITFLGLCMGGTILLALPQASTQPGTAGLLNAAFTSVSAVCVTGLIVLDTPHDFTVFGQVVIVLLIQLGGLGIMAFSTAAMGVLGRRLSLRHESALSSMLSVEDRSDLFTALRRLFVVTFGSELVGAMVLTTAFSYEGDPPGTAVWRGLFTAVSAFCNAGFALQTDSLVSYQSNPVVLHTVAILIVLGGLSPVTVASLRAFARKERVSAQTRLVLAATGLLLAAGAVLYGAIEWNYSLASLSVWDRLNNAWFQSVTLRTAGFNSVDFGSLAPASLSLMMALMFIGGSPGGTAGGIKTSTAAILMLAVYAAIRGRTEVQVFGRRIPEETVYRAASITTMGLFSAMMALLMVQLTQDMPFEMGCFEVVSALGTVGLSIGGTARLDEIGKVVIMLTMFAGRVGPLTLFIFLAGRSTASAWQVPEEPMDVG